MIWNWIKSFFKKKQRFPVPAYEVIETNGYKNPVRILSGKYEGVVYYYGTVKLPTKDHVLEFDFEIKDDEYALELNDDEEFINTMGYILLDMMGKMYNRNNQ